MNKSIKMFLITIICAIIFVSIVISIGIGKNYYCEKNPSYLLDDTCFNVDYRCGGECLMQEGNYTGIIKDKCLCDCGSFYVSYCSGFKVDKEDVKNEN